ncbi:MAG: HAD family phosphatase [Christensenellaceae bacterium]|nr:HAD family phosphatase [Christensenellaceae bacterium]
MKKMVFLSDIDGTLLKDQVPVDERVIKGARAFMESGGLFALCTGRSILSARKVAEMFRPNAPSILLTGAEIYDFANDKCLWKQPLPDNVWDKMQQVLDDYPSCGLQVCTEDKIYHLRFNDRQRYHGVREEVADPGPYTMADIKGQPLKLILAGDDREETARAGRELFSEEGYRFAFASPYFGEVVSDKAGKDTALRHISKMLGIPAEDILGAGDGMTDLPMLQAAGYSFAPSTSPKELLEACHAVIPPATEGGMAVAFEKAMQMMNEEV